MSLNEVYENITDPTEFVKNFKSKQEFIEWLDLGTPEDVECTLEAFEAAELYEYCQIIKDYISWK